MLDLLARLDALLAALNQGQKAEQTLAQLVETAEWAIPGARAAVLVYDAEQQDLRTAAGWDQLANLSRLTALTGRAEAHPGTLTLPLLAANETLGVLAVRLPDARPASKEENLVLRLLAGYAAAALSRARWMASAERKEEELVQLRRAGLLISSRLGLEETLEAILQMALEVTGAHYGIFRLLDKSGQHLVTRAVTGELVARPLVEELPVDLRSVMGWVALNRKPARIADLRAEPWADIYYRLDAELEMRSELAVPLISASGRLEGVLNLESPDVGAFSESDSHLLQSLATQAVIAIQEARLVDALQEVAGLLLSQPASQVLARLVELACDLLNAASSAIWIRRGDTLRLMASAGSGAHDERLPLRGSLAGEVVLTRAVAATADVRRDPRFCRPDLAEAQGWTRALVAPLLISGSPEASGAFAVYSAEQQPGGFAGSEWDQKVLALLAYYAALAVQNAADQEALRAAQEQRAVAETFAAVGDIAANVLHHLNNKVGAIPVRVQGIQDKSAAALAADPYLAANLAEIERSASEALAAVRENLTDLRPLTLTAVSVASCVQAALRAARLPPEIDISMQGLDNLPPVTAAQRSLTLVFTNLLENAADAITGQGSVKISGAARGNSVEVTVTDDGPGIPPALHDRIFELHYSGRGGRRGKLGFGLWWVKTLMVRLGGAVSVESDGEHGAAFHLRLPAAGGGE